MPWALASLVEYRGRLASIRSADRECLVVETSSPFEIFTPPDWNRFALVVLAEWLPVTPVVMFVTAASRPCELLGRRVREVHGLYAVKSVCGRRDFESSLPVVVGRHMFAVALLTHHSPDRTPGGDSCQRPVLGPRWWPAESPHSSR